MPGPEAIRVGTSGWHYKHWVGLFYPHKFPPARMLDFYTREFNTVEINNTFYRLPTEDAVRARSTTHNAFRSRPGSEQMSHKSCSAKNPHCPQGRIRAAV